MFIINIQLLIFIFIDIAIVCTVVCLTPIVWCSRHREAQLRAADIYLPAYSTASMLPSTNLHSYMVHALRILNNLLTLGEIQ